MSVRKGRPVGYQHKSGKSICIVWKHCCSRNHRATTARVLFTKLGKLCVFDTVRIRRRAEPCRFCRKIPFFFSLFFAERMLQPNRSRYRCFACMAFAFFLHPYRVTARSEQGGSPGSSCGSPGRSRSGRRQTRSRRCCTMSHHVRRG